MGIWVRVVYLSVLWVAIGYHRQHLTPCKAQEVVYYPNIWYIPKVYALYVV